MNFQNLFSKRLLPAVTFDRVEDAYPTAQALMKTGLNVMEIPFRTTVAAECIKSIVDKVPEMHIGAGTILTKEQLYLAKETGAEFGLSPGFNPKIVEEASKIGFPFIPGIMTPTEIEKAYEMGCAVVKVFPASGIGGPDFIRAISGPYKSLNIKYIPMGGIDMENMKDYMEINDVIAVGGTWLVPPELVKCREFNEIFKNIEQAFRTTMA